VPENTFDNIFNVQTADDNDAEGAGLIYSFTTDSGGGVDNSFFTLDANQGIIDFVAPPDFENPQDDDGDNDYQIQVTVTDSGGLTDTQDITITVTDVIEANQDPDAVDDSATTDEDTAPAQAPMAIEGEPVDIEELEGNVFLPEGEQGEAGDGEGQEEPDQTAPGGTMPDLDEVAPPTTPDDAAPENTDPANAEPAETPAGSTE